MPCALPFRPDRCPVGVPGTVAASRFVRVAGRAPIPCARSSMRCATCCAAASPGAPCPHDYPPWQTVYHYFRAWRLDGTWERLNDELRGRVRERAGRNRQPSAGILDSQSVRPRKRGASRLRRGQKADRAQAPPPGGHERPGAARGAPSGRRQRPRRVVPGAGAASPRGSRHFATCGSTPGMRAGRSPGWSRTSG